MLVSCDKKNQVPYFRHSPVMCDDIPCLKFLFFQNFRRKIFKNCLTDTFRPTFHSELQTSVYVPVRFTLHVNFCPQTLLPLYGLMSTRRCFSTQQNTDTCIPLTVESTLMRLRVYSMHVWGEVPPPPKKKIPSPPKKFCRA